ncbi:MAG: methylmalonyl Co-A mutase-associated GTPase MeaB [Chlorobi bacterium]|nr:methylmalonyl Co-A mutase-associated GTPase MeaB [Chlorobiota bacterium]
MEKKKHHENNPEYKGLKVNKGVNKMPSVNPDAAKRFIRKKRRILSPEEYINGILNGDFTTLSRAVTLIESSKPEHRDTAGKIISGCLPYSGNSIRIGITGVPGAGKSTFIETLGMHIISQGHKVAVLAIDPSSEKSKGSILGDKTRMEKLSTEKNAYIRPSPAAGSLGGVARKTRETIILCEAAGFDTIIIETVGVGQSETLVHSMVDFFLLLMLAGAGDELQGIKRGIMEMADAIAINKADGSNIEKARLAKSQYQNALHLFPLPESGWEPQVEICSALYNTGIKPVWNMIQEYVKKTKENNYFELNRKRQAKHRMYETINEFLMSDFYNNEEVKKLIPELEKQVARNTTSPYHAAKQLLERYNKKIDNK